LFSNVDAAQNLPNEIAEFEGWRLDLGAHCLYCPTQQEIHLTTAEFELLHAFVDGPQRVHSRDYLLGRVHGRESPAYDRVVDGLVARLRAKLRSGSADGGGYIKSVRGVGYMFTPKVSYKKS